MSDGLNPKQSLFLQKYLVCLNSVQAAREAGYAEPRSAGPRLLIHPKLKAAIAKAQQASLSIAILEKQKAEELLSSMAMDQANSLKDRREALKLLAQMRGWLVNKQEISGPAGSPIQLARAELSEAEIMRQLADLQNLSGGSK